LAGEREGKRGEEDTLVVHFRSGDIYTYRDSHHCIAVKDMWQPPLAFYVLAIHTHLINFPNAPILFVTEPTPGLQNVCIQRLLDVFPQARALYSTKEPYIPRKSPIFHERAMYSTKEPYIPRKSHVFHERAMHSTKEPYIPRKSPIFHERALYFTKEPYISTREPCVFHKIALSQKVFSEPSLSDSGAGNEVGLTAMESGIKRQHGVATISRLLKMISLFGEYMSFL